ncbi:hypothetical protein Esti_006248 [Eimeria stiedai]
MATAHAGRRLRTLLEAEFLLLPGAYNGISARLAEARGFKGLYLSGAALTASQGLPDIGLAPITDFTRVIREMAKVTSLPILADADTGFGSSAMIASTVHEYNAAGAAGLHIEDQQLPKRCGHLAGKVIVPIEEMVKKIRIAIEASKAASYGAFIICARTDAFAVEGFEGAVRRACEYVKAGAQMIFPEGLTSEKAFADFAGAMRNLSGPAPDGGPFLLANMTEFGVTPLMKKDTLKAAGFHCAIYPVSALRTAIKAMEDMYADLHKYETLEGYLGKMYSREVHESCSSGMNFG